LEGDDLAAGRKVRSAARRKTRHEMATGSPRAPKKHSVPGGVAWDLIEARYKTGEADIPELAAQHDVPAVVVAGRALDGRWARDREDPKRGAASRDEPEMRDPLVPSPLQVMYRGNLRDRHRRNSDQMADFLFLAENSGLLTELADLRDMSGPDEVGRWQTDQENAAFRESLILVEISRVHLELTRDMASIFEAEDKEYGLYGLSGKQDPAVAKEEKARKLMEDRMAAGDARVLERRMSIGARPLSPVRGSSCEMQSIGAVPAVTHESAHAPDPRPSVRAARRRTLGRQRNLGEQVSARLGLVWWTLQLPAQSTCMRDTSGPAECRRSSWDAEMQASRHSAQLAVLQRSFHLQAKSLAIVHQLERHEYGLAEKDAKSSGRIDGDEWTRLFMAAMQRNEDNSAAERQHGALAARQVVEEGVPPKAATDPVDGGNENGGAPASHVVAAWSDASASDVKLNSASGPSHAQWALMQLRFGQGLATTAELAEIYGVPREQIVARARAENWKLADQKLKNRRPARC
jgi:hypothetical protein